MEYVRSDDGFSQGGGKWQGRYVDYEGTARMYPGGAQSMHTVLLAWRYNPPSSDPGPCAVEMGGGAVLMCALRLAVVLSFWDPPTSLRSGGLEHLHQDGGGWEGKQARPDRQSGPGVIIARRSENPPISNKNPASSCGSPAVPRGEGAGTRGGQ